jgi:hypothetical protein
MGLKNRYFLVVAEQIESKEKTLFSTKYTSKNVCYEPAMIMV